jgi:hypothetical protein
MEAILELTKIRDESDVFYRYNIDGTTVWFSQYQNNGNIYAVTVRPNDELENIEFYVQDDSRNEIYYPKWVEISTCHESLNVDSVDDYINELKYAKETAKAIMDIFESGAHKEYYDKLHNI